MKYFIAFLSLMLAANIYAAVPFELAHKSTSEFTVSQNTGDTLIISEITFTSEGKQFKYKPVSADTLIRGKSMTVNYSKDLPKFNDQIIYKATIKYTTTSSPKSKKASITIYGPNERYNPNGESVQCRGITQKGTQCKRYTTDPSGYCWQHGR